MRASGCAAGLAVVLLWALPARADTWQAMNQKGCAGLSFVDATTGYLLRGRSIGGFKLHKLQAGNWDAGIDVTTIGAPSGTGVHDMHFVDASTGYVVANERNVYKTTDGGATWKGTLVTVKGAQTVFDIRRIDFGSKTHGVIVGNYGTTVLDTPFIATTVDGGATWNEATLPPGSQGLSAAAMAGAGTLVVGGLRGAAAAGLWTSSDGGATWKQRNILAKGVTDVIFITDSIGFVVSYPPVGVAANNEQILRTTDGGQNWTSPMTGTLPLQVLSSAWVDKDNGFVGGRSADNKTLAIARTKNGGATWALETLPTGAEFEKPNDLMGCLDYPGPAAYAGTGNGTTSTLKIDAAGGSRASRYGNAPSADAGPTADATAPNDGGAPKDATTKKDAATTKDSGAKADSGGSGGGGGGGGCAIGSPRDPRELLLGLLCGLLGWVVLRRRRDRR